MKLKRMIGALAAVGLATPLLCTPSIAQQRVEITGSSIKRVADEGALPLQIITSDDIRQLGLTSAEALVRTLGANAANVDNATSRNNVFGAER